MLLEKIRSIVLLGVSLFAMPTKAEWQVRTYTDAMTDIEYRMAVGFAENNGIKNGPALGIRCYETNLDTLLFFEAANIKATPSNAEHEIDLRIDKEVMVTTPLQISSDEKVAFIPKDITLLMTEMYTEYETFLFRKAPASGIGDIPVKVNLSGASSTIREACGDNIDAILAEMHELLEETRQAAELAGKNKP